MRKTWCWIMLVAAACSSDEYINKSQAVGEWQIDWSFEEMTASGELILNPNGLANLRVTKNQNNLLAENADEFQFNWELSSDELKLRRIDSDLILRYQVLIQEDDIMSLLYADDIQITLRRIR